MELDPDIQSKHLSPPPLETLDLDHTDDITQTSSFEVLDSQPKTILPSPGNNNKRLWDVDLLRGLVMILLAIEYVYDNFMVKYDPYRGESWWNEAYWDGSPIEFFTNQVSRPSSTGFFLIMGMGMSFLFDSRKQEGWTKSRILHFFVVRGIILIVIQLIGLTSYQAYIQIAKHHPSSVIIGGTPEPLWVIELGSLWGLGISMIISSAILIIQNAIDNTYCLLLPPIPIMEGRWGSSLVVIIIILSMVITKISIPEEIKDITNKVNPLVGVLIVPGYYYYSSSLPAVYTQYTLLPWLGVVLLGVLLGQRLLYFGEKAYTLIGFMSGLMLFGFLFFQVMCYYGLTCIGNFRKFSKLNNYYSFWCFTKYPPDFVFLLWTVGLNLTFLCIIHKALFLVHEKWMFTPIKVFGATSLCFFALHIFLSSLLSAPFPQGLSDIGWLYLEWIVLLYITYPFCSAYLWFKQHQRKNSFWRYL